MRADYRVARICSAVTIWELTMKVLKIVGVVFVAMVVAVAVLLLVGVPSGFVTSMVQERVQRETGYRIGVAGATRVGIWPALHVSLNDVSVENGGARDASEATPARSPPWVRTVGRMPCASSRSSSIAR